MRQLLALNLTFNYVSSLSISLYDIVIEFNVIFIHPWISLWRWCFFKCNIDFVFEIEGVFNIWQDFDHGVKYSRDRRFIIFVSFYITWIKTVHEVLEIWKYCSKRLQINFWLAWTVCNTSIYAHLPAWLALRVDQFDVVLYYHQYICINQQQKPSLSWKDEY